MSDIRIGIVGTGNIAGKFAQACAMTPGVCAAAVASRHMGTGIRFASENGIPQMFLGVKQMVASAEIDLIYVATPHTTHYEICMAALRAGKHVLCEKPMATRRIDAERLFAEAKLHGLFLMEGMWPRFLPYSILARQWVCDGRIGKIRFIDSMWSFAVDPTAPKPRLVQPSLGGGAMFDLGVYMVSMTSYYAGADPLTWEGFCTPYCDGVDATSVMTLRYPQGILATTRMGITCDTPIFMTIYGEKGRIELPRFFLANEIRLYQGEHLVAREQQNFMLPQGFCWQIAAVRDHLLRGETESVLVPPKSTIATAGVMENMMLRFFPTGKEKAKP